MKQVLIKYFPFALIILLLGSCIVDPDFADEPVIGYESIDNKPLYPGTPTGGDSVIFVVSYKDGDGDLGLNEQHKEEFKGQTVTVNGEEFSLELNFHIIVKKKNANGQYERIAFKDDAPFGGAFAPLKDKDDIDIKSPLEGEIRYVGLIDLILATDNEIQVGDELIFDIFIIDRARHVSNVITTDPVIVGQFD
ncbi:hypothetical protein AAG747_14525 [Rapidithrix thailandica]|uniref:Uncharacterized protein n=1 Tax=Rapidithrix thailandica TaxID=413964 RepID=A0AAW9S9J5_9BACT